MNVRNMISMLASRMVWATLVSTHTVLAFQNGDTCGVTSRDFMNYDYRSDHLIAGTAGCTFRSESAGEGNEDDTGCFCAPNLDDEQSLGVWQWQCNGVVDFGPNPRTTKTCPSTVPVAKGLGFLSFITNRNLADEDDISNTSPQPIVVGIGTESQQQQQVVACDQTIHPTGHPGDEVCPYSDCDTGGDHSAICSCVNLAEYGMGDGMQWICMHGTCNCADDDDDDGRNAPAPQDATSSLPPSSAPTSVPPESAASSPGSGRYWWLQNSGSIIAALYFMTLA